jgi:hypothetical protein
VCRFIEGKWRCWGDEVISEANPKNPFDDWETLPPYLDYQVASLVIERILVPLRRDVLHELQDVVNEHRPEDWYVTFLACFILLQNYELQMQFQRGFAAKRNAKVLYPSPDTLQRCVHAADDRQVQYLDMPLVRATNSGAKTILAHFHYCCKGQRPFRADFDWNSPKLRKMAHLDAEQSDFMANYRDLVIGKGTYHRIMASPTIALPPVRLDFNEADEKPSTASFFNAINQSDSYHEKYWYTSQLFDPEWVPRNTLEHAPPAEQAQR